MLRPIPGRMSVRSIRQSLNGISRALAARNLAIADRLELIRHQATLMDELRKNSHSLKKPLDIWQTEFEQ
jgi:hypothetical protein